MVAILGRSRGLYLVDFGVRVLLFWTDHLLRGGAQMSNPFQHEPRKQFTPQQRARIFALREGKCHRCTRKIGVSDWWSIEHVTALCNGGNNDDDNLALTCEWCFPIVNAEDAADHAKGRRAYTRHVVPTQFRKSKSWGRR